MHREWVALAKAHQVMQRAPAGNQIVLREDFEPVDGRLTGENCVVVVDAQPEPEAERGAGQHEGGRRTGRESAPGPQIDHLPALAFAASQSALVISRYPLPLQEF